MRNSELSQKRNGLEAIGLEDLPLPPPVQTELFRNVVAMAAPVDAEKQNDSAAAATPGES